MNLFALLLILNTPPPQPLDLAFIHGDEALASWVETSSVQREGTLVRSRVLRVRHGNQPFWLVHETDCAAGTSALVAAKNITSEDARPPPLEGEARHSAARPYDHLDRALRAAVCQGQPVFPEVAPIGSVDAAMAASQTLSAAAIRQRSLELIEARSGSGRVLIDRATLDGGGPQWEVRSLTLTANGRSGVWSWWEVDCDPARRTADLRWSAPFRADGAYGPREEHAAPAMPVRPGSVEATVWAIACDPAVWTRPVASSIASRQRAG